MEHVDRRGDFVDVPGVVRLLGLGFEPVETLPPTLWACFAVWPKGHRASVRETRPHWRTRGGQELQLLRSPHPDIPLRGILGAVHARATTHADWELNPARTADAARDLLALSPGELRPVCEAAAYSWGSEDRR